MDAADVITGLQALACDNGVSRLQIDELTRLRGGVSSEIWAFDGTWKEGHEERRRALILRTGCAHEFSFAGRVAEYRVLKALEASDIPAPRVYWFDPEGHHLGRQAMVMERCVGVADRMLLTPKNRFGLDEQERTRLARRMIELLGKIHAIDVSTTDIEEATPHSNPAETKLRQHDEAIVSLELEPLPELRIASWWLWRHLPPSPARRTIVHGDYRPANMLFADGVITALLDWEFTGVGDPMEDLGWYLSPYYATEHLIPGTFEYDDVIALYEQVTGTTADRAAILFWSVFAIYKLAYMTVAALRWMVDGDPSRMTASAGSLLKPLLEAITSRAGGH